MAAEVEPGDAFTTPMEICWQFAYEIDHAKLKALYTKAKRLQWDAEEALDWDTPVDPSRPLMDEERFGLLQLPFLQKLSQSQKDSLRAHTSAQQLSQFLHGEQGALMTAASLTHAVPDYEAKLYAATQTMDEARHVEAYDRYIKKIAVIYPMHPALRKLVDDTLRADHWVKIAIGMNMIVEGLALGAFHNMRRAASCTLLRAIIDGVLRDEARHVAFGSFYVRETVAEMHPDDREDVADFAFEAMRAMHGVRGRRGEWKPDPTFRMVLENVGIDPMDFVRGVMETRASGFRITPPKGQVNAFRDLMLPALVRVGVVTDRVRSRYAEAGITVNDDTTVLDAFEHFDRTTA